MHPQRRQRGRRARVPQRAAGLPRHPGGDRGHARAAARARRCTPSSRSTRPTPTRAGSPGELVAAGGDDAVSWILAFAGFAVLIILHELGHFAAAKAVGMRVERFSLFFGRTPLRFQRGETEYGIGWIPLGGFVKITGMNPQEEIPAEVAPRAYYRQPVWKRIVVISAGPAVNIVLAFVILWAVWSSIGDPREAKPTDRIEQIEPGRRPPACCSRATGSSPSTAAAATPTRCASRSPAHVRGRGGATAARPPSRSGSTIERGGERAHGRGAPGLQRREQAAAARLRLRHRPGPPVGPVTAARAERRPDVVLHHAGRSRRSRRSSRPRSARRSRASSAPTRSRARHRARADARRSSCSP